MAEFGVSINFSRKISHEQTLCEIHFFLKILILIFLADAQ
jgi:hypothetical protein